MDRKLTKDEERRKEIFDKKCEEMIKSGYQKKMLHLSNEKVNSDALKMMIPTIVLIILAYIFLGAKSPAKYQFSINPFLILLIYFILIVIHELIHGIFFAIFAEKGFKDISFGIVWKHLTPYCSCVSPLRLKEYLIGALMPLVILGIIPTLLSVILGRFDLLFIGLPMVTGAFGDILIVRNILKNIDKQKEILILDHPTEIGSVAFEKEK
ncbi:DUF3267 domain-containing protein [Streptobacillus canis]|uniref:DUF3267 domain-containing protein n=1 Tax=Streptobacillus canis TaxID=2678686 RepID=UPI0012E23D02|nr:DUF3267 domain-containing protein [Streptobacillus canis]